MGLRLASSLAPGILVVALLCLHLAQAGLVPFTLKPTVAELERRDLSRHASRLQPRHEVELHYADETAVDQRYMATAVARHDSRPYVLVEDFDDVLDRIRCSSTDKTSSTVIEMTFKDSVALDLAREEWPRHQRLNVITHHQSCNNDFGQRAVYICSSFDFKDEDMLVRATCELTRFGPTTEASTSLRLKGGLVSPEDAGRLQSRSWEGRRRPVKRAESSHTFPLDQPWDRKELLLGIPHVDLSCIDCSFQGEMALDFDIDVSGPGWKRLTGPMGFGGPIASVLKTASLKLRTVRPLAAKVNYQLDVQTAVKFSWPGLKAAVGKAPPKPTLGKKMVKKQDKKLFKVGDFELVGTYRYGVTFALDARGTVQMNFPATAEMPAGQYMNLDFLNPLASTSAFTPKVQFETPRFRMHEPEVCVSIGVGPGLDVVLAVNAPNLGKVGTSFYFSLQTGIEVPKVQTCFTKARNVNDRCMAGTIAEAIKERTTIGLGVKLESWFKAQKAGWLVPQAPMRKWDLGPILHPTCLVSHRCLDFQVVRRLLGLDSRQGRSALPPSTKQADGGQSGPTRPGLRRRYMPSRPAGLAPPPVLEPPGPDDDSFNIPPMMYQEINLPGANSGFLPQLDSCPFMKSVPAPGSRRRESPEGVEEPPSLGPLPPGPSPIEPPPADNGKPETEPPDSRLSQPRRAGVVPAKPGPVNLGPSPSVDDTSRPPGQTAERRPSRQPGQPGQPDQSGQVRRPVPKPPPSIEALSPPSKAPSPPNDPQLNMPSHPRVFDVPPHRGPDVPPRAVEKPLQPSPYIPPRVAEDPSQLNPYIPPRVIEKPLQPNPYVPPAAPERPEPQPNNEFYPDLEQMPSCDDEAESFPPRMPTTPDDRYPEDWPGSANRPRYRFEYLADRSAVKCRPSTASFRQDEVPRGVVNI